MIRPVYPFTICRKLAFPHTPFVVVYIKMLAIWLFGLGNNQEHASNKSFLHCKNTQFLCFLFIKNRTKQSWAFESHKALIKIDQRSVNTYSVHKHLYEYDFLTSTLMAHLPMARTAFLTKSTSTSVAYSFSSASTCQTRKKGHINTWFWSHVYGKALYYLLRKIHDMNVYYMKYLSTQNADWPPQHHLGI